MVVVLLLCPLLWEKQPLLALLGREDWAAGMASWAAGPAAPKAAGWAAARPSAVAGVGRSLEQAGAVALVALVV